MPDTEIEKRFEAPDHREPNYTGRTLSAKQIRKGVHRKAVGGHWDTHGLHQLEFLQSEGLQPHHVFLDVGCGSLRAGRHFVDYLEPGNYYGMDANVDLLKAGYDHELTDEQRNRLPSKNLHASDRFDVDFGVEFDMALAQSVFTHISLNNIRLCLHRVAPHMKTGGVFYVTFNEQPPETPIDAVIPSQGKSKYGERNTYWYYRADIRWAASFGPWEYRYIGRWGHPGKQRMIAFTRLPDPEPVESEPVETRQLRGGKARALIPRRVKVSLRRLLELD